MLLLSTRCHVMQATVSQQQHVFQIRCDEESIKLENDGHGQTETGMEWLRVFLCTPTKHMRHDGREGLGPSSCVVIAGDALDPKLDGWLQRWRRLRPDSGTRCDYDFIYINYYLIPITEIESPYALVSYVVFSLGVDTW